MHSTHIDSLPDSVLLNIFTYIDGCSLCRVACVCSRWRDVAYDESLYKLLLKHELKADIKNGLAPDKYSWRAEYKRLIYHIPTELTETLTDHEDEVLHVSFSYDGHLFSTTSKDCTVKVWEIGYPTSQKYSYDFREYFGWDFTQFSCFSYDDSKLLVSSVKSGRIDRRGYVAILSIEHDFQLLMVVDMDPSQLFGAWLNSKIFLGGSLDINFDGMALVSVHIKAFKVNHNTKVFNAATDSKALFTFSSETASLIKFLTVVECPENNRKDHVQLTETNLSTETSGLQFTRIGSEKLLVYVTGEFSVALHQIGVKRIPADAFSNSVNIPEQEEGEDVISFLRNNEVELRARRNPDSSDEMLDLNGHVTGLCLSTDNRYLYVNCRPWVGEVHRDDPMNTPNVAEDMEVRVIEIDGLKDTGIRYKGHKGLSSANMCCFVFLDTSTDYVASGSENCKGYIWDKHYGCCLATYQHGNGVVNAVAFNPFDQECLVTVSDDKTIKIWRSRNKLSQRN